MADTTFAQELAAASLAGAVNDPVARVGGPFQSLAASGQARVRRRNVAWSAVDNNSGFTPGGSGGTYTTEDFPVVAPSGQRVGAKVVIAGAAGAQGAVKSFAFAASAPGGAPSTYGFKPFVKAAGQVVYALVFVDGDPYQNNYATTDTINLKLFRDGSNWVDWYFSSTVRLKSGWNFLTARWDETDNAIGPVATYTGTFPDGAMCTQATVNAQAGNGNFTFRVAEVGWFAAPPAKPMVMLTFDGYYGSHTAITLPLLQSAGVKAAFTTSGELWLNEASMPLALYAAGMDVGQQVARHIDYPQNDGLYPLHLDRAITYMRQLGLDWDIQSMPFNDITRSQVDTARSRGVKLIREARSPGTPIVEWGLGAGSINIGQTGMDNVSLASLKKIADAAVRYGDLRATTGHEVIAGGDGTTLTGSSTQMYANDLSAFIAYALSIGVTFITPRQLLRSMAAMQLAQGQQS